jgi:hypothetical protein
MQVVFKKRQGILTFSDSVLQWTFESKVEISLPLSHLKGS